MKDMEPIRFRREIIAEEFFEIAKADAQSRWAKAPLDAQILFNNWKSEEITKRNIQRIRHDSFTEDITEYVEVCMGPAVQDGQSGYSVRKEVVYPYTEKN